MAYRDDPEPLKTQESSLISELSSLHLRERDVQRALDQTRADLNRKRALPMLDRVQIASPCSASWGDMVGDDRVRHCGACNKSVYNVAEMSRDEAEALLIEQEGTACLRLFRRADGTVMTSDCHVGIKHRRVRRIVAAVVAATFGPAALATIFSGRLVTEYDRHERDAGKINGVIGAGAPRGEHGDNPFAGHR